MHTATDIKNLKEIKDFLDENGLEYSTEYDNFCLHYGNPDGKRSYEICYVASHEYPISYKQYGIAGVDAAYFYELSHKAEHEQNSFKCWVKDYEWADDRKREVLKSYFMHAAGKTRYKFYARDCEVREVSTPVARKFESENCFYGKRGASLNLGLYLRKEKNGLPAGTLMMIYTFGKNFFGKDDSIEVLRVGTKKFSNVVGGASKLLKHFIYNYPVLRIGAVDVPVTVLKFYSDYDHNIGNSMDELGFKFVSYSGGGFMNYWVATGEVKGRQPNKHKWVMEQMKEGKVLAIPNAGVKTFVMYVDRSTLPPPPEKIIDPNVGPEVLF
jgi:hypothetical protein